MAKKRKVMRDRKVAPPKATARRRTVRRSSSNGDETMSIIAGILVVILIGLGIYFYQASQKTGALPMSSAVAMAAEKQ